MRIEKKILRQELLIGLSIIGLSLPVFLFVVIMSESDGTNDSFNRAGLLTAFALFIWGTYYFFHALNDFWRHNQIDAKLNRYNNLEIQLNALLWYTLPQIDGYLRFCNSQRLHELSQFYPQYVNKNVRHFTDMVHLTNYYLKKRKGF